MGVAYGKMFWSSEDIVTARFDYAESRQNKPTEETKYGQLRKQNTANRGNINKKLYLIFDFSVYIDTDHS